MHSLFKPKEHQLILFMKYKEFGINICKLMMKKLGIFIKILYDFA